MAVSNIYIVWKLLILTTIFLITIVTSASLDFYDFEDLEDGVQHLSSKRNDYSEEFLDVI